MKTKSRRWVCPDCGTGKLAPSRPRRDDVRRYCLRCSERTGRLVERVCPVNERARELAEERSKKKAGRRRAVARKRREAAKESARERRSRLAPYEAFFRRALRLKSWEVDLATRPPRTSWSFASDGHASGCANAWNVSVRFGVNVSSNLEVVLHELAHSAFERRRLVVDGEPRAHNSVFRTILAAATSEVVGFRVDPAASTYENDLRCKRALREWLEESESWFSRRYFPELVVEDGE